MNPEQCNNTIYRDGKPTAESCVKPAGHKSVCVPATGYSSDSRSPVRSTGDGSSADEPVRVVLESALIGRTLYISAQGVEMLLMDMHMQARNDGERELVAKTVESLRTALRNG